MEIFSKRLRQLRIEKGFTQQDIAQMLCIKQQSYTRYETGKGEPNLESLVMLAKIFDVSADYLLGLSEI